MSHYRYHAIRTKIAILNESENIAFSYSETAVEQCCGSESNLDLNKFKKDKLRDTFFSSKTIFYHFFKIDDKTLDSDRYPNWAKIQDPDPNTMYRSPQHCCGVLYNKWYREASIICTSHPNKVEARRFLMTIINICNVKLKKIFS